MNVEEENNFQTFWLSLTLFSRFLMKISYVMFAKSAFQTQSTKYGKLKSIFWVNCVFYRFRIFKNALKWKRTVQLFSFKLQYLKGKILA